MKNNYIKELYDLQNLWEKLEAEESKELSEKLSEIVCILEDFCSLYRQISRRGKKLSVLRAKIATENQSECLRCTDDDYEDEEDDGEC